MLARDGAQRIETPFYSIFVFRLRSAGVPPAPAARLAPP